MSISQEIYRILLRTPSPQYFQSTMVGRWIQKRLVLILSSVPDSYCHSMSGNVWAKKRFCKDTTRACAGIYHRYLTLKLQPVQVQGISSGGLNSRTPTQRQMEPTSHWPVRLASWGDSIQQGSKQIQCIQSFIHKYRYIDCRARVLRLTPHTRSQR